MCVVSAGNDFGLDLSFYRLSLYSEEKDAIREKDEEDWGNSKATEKKAGGNV